jgi:serine protease AprX
MKVDDDDVASFSASSAGCGSLCKNPDFVAPGAHLEGLRVPNSYIDAHHPEGRLDASFFRGSGTSEATAVAAGAVALVLQRFPNITPDMIKRYVTSTAVKLGGFDSQAQGAGELRLGEMFKKTPPAYQQKFTAATGTGTLEAARGTDRITRDGVALSGERDIFGAAVDTRALAALEASGSSWSGGSWNGSSWSGSSWSGSSWSGSSWSGSSWSGSSWSGSSWSGSSWSGSSWSGSSWSGDVWASDSWG